MAAYLGYTLRMKTLFHAWPVMVHDMHTRRRRRLHQSLTVSKNWAILYAVFERFLGIWRLPSCLYKEAISPASWPCSGAPTPVFQWELCPNTEKTSRRSWCIVWHVCQPRGCLFGSWRLFWFQFLLGWIEVHLMWHWTYMSWHSPRYYYFILIPEVCFVCHGLHSAHINNWPCFSFVFISKTIYKQSCSV